MCRYCVLGGMSVRATYMAIWDCPTFAARGDLGPVFHYGELVAAVQSWVGTARKEPQRGGGFVWPLPPTLVLGLPPPAGSMRMGLSLSRDGGSCVAPVAVRQRGEPSGIARRRAGEEGQRSGGAGRPLHSPRNAGVDAS